MIDRYFFEKTLTCEELLEHIRVREAQKEKMLKSPDVYSSEIKHGTIGRAIEAFYRYWVLTGSPNALRVMQKAVDCHRQYAVCLEGNPEEWRPDPFCVNHNHSYLGTIRGLLLYAIHFEDRELIEAVHRTYHNCIRKYSCDETGFAPHDFGVEIYNDEFGDPLGDHASCADTIYIAYLLATKCGYTELLDDVEKLMRCRLFYCQNTSEENFGAWGIFGGHYFANSITLDVFALIASTLCYIYNSMIEEKEDRTYIYLHFSKETAAVTVESERDEKQHTKITPHAKKQIWIHIPSWCTAKSVAVTDDKGNAVSYTMEGEYLVLTEKVVVPGETLEVSYELPVGETIAKTWKSGKSYRCLWKGDTLANAEEIKG